MNTILYFYIPLILGNVEEGIPWPEFRLPGLNISMLPLL